MLLIGLIILIALGVGAYVRNAQAKSSPAFADTLAKIARSLGLELANPLSAHPYIQGIYEGREVKLVFESELNGGKGFTQFMMELENPGELWFKFTRVGSSKIEPVQEEYPDPVELVFQRIKTTEKEKENLKKILDPQLATAIITQIGTGVEIRLEGNELLLSESMLAMRGTRVKAYMRLLKLMADYVESKSFVVGGQDEEEIQF